MAKVIAHERGYYGGIIREPGDVFEAKGKSLWFEPVSGGSKAKPADPEPAASEDGDLSAMTVKGLRELAKERGIGLGADVTTKAEIIEAIEAGPDPEPAAPFSDAPAPVRVKNEINDALGTTQPDWVSPADDDI